MRHKHSMTRSLANILLDLNFHADFHLQKDLDLTKNQYANFQKLKYWGLVKQVKDKAGYWIVTQHGIAFANNVVKVPKNIFTFNNQVVRSEGPMVCIDELTDLWKNRESYISEMEPAFDRDSSQFQYRFNHEILN